MLSTIGRMRFEWGVSCSRIIVNQGLDHKIKISPQWANQFLVRPYHTTPVSLRLNAGVKGTIIIGDTKTIVTSLKNNEGISVFTDKVRVWKLFNKEEAVPNKPKPPYSALKDCVDKLNADPDNIIARQITLLGLIKYTIEVEKNPTDALAYSTPFYGVDGNRFCQLSKGWASAVSHKDGNGIWDLIVTGKDDNERRIIARGFAGSLKQALEAKLKDVQFFIRKKEKDIQFIDLHTGKTEDGNLQNLFEMLSKGPPKNSEALKVFSVLIPAEKQVLCNYFTRR